MTEHRSQCFGAVAVLFLFLFIVEAAAVWQSGSPASTGALQNGKRCTVYAHGNEKDDTPQILEAFKDCNNGGTVVFPQHQNYWIATKLNPVIFDVTIEWKGTWTVGLSSHALLSARPPVQHEIAASS